MAARVRAGALGKAEAGRKGRGLVAAGQRGGNDLAATHVGPCGFGRLGFWITVQCPGGVRPVMAETSSRMLVMSSSSASRPVATKRLP